MRSIYLLLAAGFLTFICPPLFANGIWAEISGEAVYGAGADTLDVNKPFTLTVWVSASDSAWRSFWSVPLQFSGLGDVKKLSRQDYALGPNFKVHDQYGGLIMTESWDGALSTADRIGYKASPTAPGWDIPSPYKYFDFEFVIEGDRSTEGYFLIDSCDFSDGQFDWAFEPPELYWVSWMPMSWPVKMNDSEEADCGDINGDNNTDILDIVALIEYKYRSGTPPASSVFLDFNGDKDVNILDVVCLVNYLFKDGPPPDCP